MKGKNITIVSRETPRKIRSDLDRLRKLTDAEIDASIANDPDWQEFKDIDWSKAVLVIPPKKKAISIRVDEDVLDYFKKEGSGYQRRINAVLRSYMQQKRKKRA
ncbi:MAG TPA: BrnA antitoxin family protein [Xanthobacteraceae bacterium]|nr:BrnA antitoxin family protein [Xanthobacteraceae bacterium]